MSLIEVRQASWGRFRQVGKLVRLNLVWQAWRVAFLCVLVGYVWAGEVLQVALRLGIIRCGRCVMLRNGKSSFS